MKKRVFGRKLSRNRNSRKALFRAQIRALIEHGSIKTTKAKAKSIQGQIDKLVTLAKSKDVAKRRAVFARLGNDRKSTDKLFVLAADKLSRNSGFTKLINLNPRRGDMAEVVRLSWSDDVSDDEVKGKKKKIAKKQPKLKSNK